MNVNMISTPNYVSINLEVKIVVMYCILRKYNIIFTY
jgi:hypothetical protein